MLPVLAYKWVRYGKYKESFPKRLGLNFPVINKEGRFLIWVHAISVGETRAIAPLVRLIKKEKPDCIIVFSNITETGHEEALNYVKEADYHVYLPFDLPYIIRPIVQRVQPNLLILTETDFWYHFQDEVKAIGGKIAVVNAKVSKRSLKRYRILPWLISPLFKSLDLILAQSDTYKDRFLELSIMPDNIRVTGNVKLDDVYPELTAQEVLDWKERLGIGPQDKVLVIGSTHDPEEKMLLQQIKKIWKKKSINLKVLIAPRHPERFKKVSEILQRLDIPFATWSKGDKLDDIKRVLLVDTMGKLRGCYQLADIAIVAGSFADNVGGHNLLEPSWYGKPVLYGPHVYKQQDFAELIRQNGAGLQIDSDEVAETLIHLLQNPEISHKMGLSGSNIFKEARGATLKSWQFIKTIY